MTHSTIVLAQCTNSKFECTDEAQTLYSKSSYFRKQRKYAQLKGDAWYIQSARHGLLKPDTVIEYYNQHASEIDHPQTWAREIAESLRDRHNPPASIIVLGGRDYANPLLPELETRGFDVVEPLRGLGIGERQAQLDYLISEMQNESLEVQA